MKLYCVLWHLSIKLYIATPVLPRSSCVTKKKKRDITKLEHLFVLIHHYHIALLTFTKFSMLSLGKKEIIFQKAIFYAKVYAILWLVGDKSTFALN